MPGAGSRPVVIGPGSIGPLRSLLERFRRGAGVPASVGGELSTELAPVFAALDRLEREVEELRARSEGAVVQRLQETEDEVRKILDEGRRRAILERDDALRSGLEEVDAEAAAIARGAEAEAETIARRGRERLPALVAEVLVRVVGETP